MSYWFAITVVAVCAIGAALAALFVDRTIDLELRRRHHEVGNQVFQLIGVLFSVMLAFVFSEVWGQYNTAAQAISSECGALHGAAMLANALPANEGRQINLAIQTYVGKVAAAEWPVMAEQRRSTEAAQDLHKALDRAAQLPSVAHGYASVQSEILSLLAEAHSYRETRTFQLALGLPLAMWLVLLFLAGILIGFVVFSGSEHAGSIVFSASFAGSIVSVLVLVRMLDYPFEGALALSNADFVKLGSQVTAMLASH